MRTIRLFARIWGSLLASVAVSSVFFSAGRASATEYYVAPSGSDAAAGTMAQPFATLQKGGDVASAGDTVWLRAGTYKYTRQVKLSKSGTSDAMRIRFWAYQKEIPVIDFSGYVPSGTSSDVPALLVTGSWLHLRGLEIANVPVGRSGAHSISTLRSTGASNNTFELLDIHNGFGPGLFIDGGSGGNLILNCDSHDNYDKNGSQGDGQNGDGFGVHYQMTGPSTVIRGCRSWFNSDDGYDLISQEVPVQIESCWAARNGYANMGTSSPSSGNGNGFKAGSSKTGIRHTLQNNVAWRNKAAGFYANHSSGGNTWLNNTAYMNGTAYNMLASPAGNTDASIMLSGALAHKMRNNVGFPNKNSNMGGVDSMFNTWDLNVTEVSTDFVSTMDTGFDAARQADGSPPAIDFLKLRAGSPLIDKGTNVSLDYVGTAPDLGAYEFGAVVGGPGGSAGSAGSGPSASASGSDGASAGSNSIAGSTGDAGVVPAAGADNTGVAGAMAFAGAPSSAGNSGSPTSAASGGTSDATGCTCSTGSRSNHYSGTLAATLTALGAFSIRRRRRVQA